MEQVKKLNDYLLKEDASEFYSYIGLLENWIIYRNELLECVGDDPANSSFGQRVWTVCLADIFEAISSTQPNYKAADERLEELYYNVKYGDADIFKETDSLCESLDLAIAAHRSLSIRDTYTPPKYTKGVPKFRCGKYTCPVSGKEAWLEEQQLTFDGTTHKLPSPSIEELSALNDRYSEIHWQWLYGKLKEENNLNSSWQQIYTTPVGE